MGIKYDFSGWATKNDIRCSDGLTIRRDAFVNQDGDTVPLVWQHQHNSPDNVLGHGILRNMPEGVKFYGVFNDTEQGRNAKTLVQSGDVNMLSIWANGLTKRGTDVLHGCIREVSLVLAGANPGAYIDIDSIAHSDSGDDSLEGTIYTGEELIDLGGELEFAHAEKEEETVANENDSKNTSAGDKTVKEIYDAAMAKLSEDEQNVLLFVMSEMMSSAAEEVKHSIDEEGDDNMKVNVFEQNNSANTLAHAEAIESFTADVFKDAQKYGSLKDAFNDHLAHAEEDYGITDIELLFPDAKAINNTPEFIKRRTEWVNDFMSKTTHRPYSRIKCLFADITADEARAKGYVKSAKKADEVFKLLKRTTTPQTIYKKQRFDRDDIIDVTDLDVVAFTKGEMRIMYDEEIARAALIGDGRSSTDPDKISEEHIRPIYNMEDLFTVKYEVTLPTNATDADKAEAILDAAVLARTQYEGSGTPTAYMDEDYLAQMLIMKDDIGHRLYKDANELAVAMRVSNIVTVPVMKGLTRTAEVNGATKTYDVHCIIVNPVDYTFGADKGGELNMFDDFDINYNQMIYLMEGRCSGSLTKPHSAIVLETARA